MKRIAGSLRLAGLLILVIAALVGCRGNTAGGGRLYIYNWTYYIPDEVIAAFEQEFDVKVVYDMFASNEEMFAKLRAGGIVFWDPDVFGRIDRGRLTATSERLIRRTISSR